MTVSGGPSRPRITVINAQSVAAGGNVSGSADVSGARFAMIEWEASTGDTITMDAFASSDTDDATQGYLYPGLSREAVGPLSSGAPGRSAIVELGRTVGRLKVTLTNGGAGATTVSAWITPAL